MLGADVGTVAAVGDVKGRLNTFSVGLHPTFYVQDLGSPHHVLCVREQLIARHIYIFGRSAGCV